MPELAYVNGAFCPIGEAVVSIEDRGFQFGDGVYEVVIAYDGRPFLLDEHLQRFRRSAAAIGLDFDFDAQPLEPIVREGVSRGGFRDTLVYMQITRGVAPRMHAAPTNATPTIVMTFKPFESLPDATREKGVTVMTTPETRWSNCYIKAITLLPNVLAKTEAERRGYFDAIFVTADGEARELTAANLFMVKGGCIITPPCNESVLHGITQSFIVECARAIDMTVEEAPIPLDTLRGADEVFMSSSTTEVLGIVAIDDRHIAEGCVGPATQRIHQEFKRRAHEVLRSTDQASVTM